MNGYLRIGGALVMGAFIVLGTFVLSRNEKGSEYTGTVASAETIRSYIEVTDVNENGIEDWREAFEASGKSIDLPAWATPSSTEPYTPPTTFTGQFAESFFQTYLSTKMENDGVVDIDNLVSESVSVIDENTRAKIYTAGDFIVIPDSPEALHDYGNAVVTILLKETGARESDLIVLERALEANNPELLAPLKVSEQLYGEALSALLSTPVPESLVRAHTVLTSALGAMEKDASGMRRVFDDPLLGYAHMQQYRANVNAFFSGIYMIVTDLVSKGVSYESDEPGSIIYLLNV